MNRTLAQLAATLFAASLAQAQAPAGCPSQGETEIAPPGRTSTTSECGLGIINFHWAAGREGAIRVVQAEDEGAIQFSQTTPALVLVADLQQITMLSEGRQQNYAIRVISFSEITWIALFCLGRWMCVFVGFTSGMVMLCSDT